MHSISDEIQTLLRQQGPENSHPDCMRFLNQTPSQCLPWNPDKPLLPDATDSKMPTSSEHAFSRFGSLPLELRDQIWDTVVQQIPPRFITLYHVVNRAMHHFNTPLLSVCQESRRRVQMRYQPWGSIDIHMLRNNMMTNERSPRRFCNFYIDLAKDMIINHGAPLVSTRTLRAEIGPRIYGRLERRRDPGSSLKSFDVITWSVNFRQSGMMKTSVWYINFGSQLQIVQLISNLRAVVHQSQALMFVERELTAQEEFHIWQGRATLVELIEDRNNAQSIHQRARRLLLSAGILRPLAGILTLIQCDTDDAGGHRVRFLET